MLVRLLAASFVVANLAHWLAYFLAGQKASFRDMREISIFLCFVSLFIIVPYGSLKKLEAIGWGVLGANVAILATLLLL